MALPSVAPVPESGSSRATRTFSLVGAGACGGGAPGVTGSGGDTAIFGGLAACGAEDNPGMVRPLQAESAKAEKISHAAAARREPTGRGESRRNTRTLRRGHIRLRRA